MSNTSDMVDVFNNIDSETKNVVDESKAKISVLDQAKTPYVKAATNVDRSLHNQITSVNDTLYATRDAYDERIDVQECRSDLFWRLTGLTSVTVGPGPSTQNQYTFTCTKLNTVYEKSASGVSTYSVGFGATVGFSTNRVVRLENDGSFYSYEVEVEGDKLIGIGSSLDTYYEPDNLHGLKLYNEPYARDLIDTFRASGIGTVGVGVAATTNRITILSPSNETPIKVGQLMTPSKTGYFATQYVTVTAVGTTAVDLSTYPFSGITTSTPVTVPYITVDSLPVAKIDAPLDDGSYVNMVFTQDPNTIDDSYAVGITDNPYVDQSITLMSYSQAGTGVKIQYDNSGISSGTRTWNKFMDGFSDPNSDDIDAVISEPPLGADKIYYRVGFTEKPVSSGVDAIEGDTLVLTQQQVDTIPSIITVYSTLPACNDTELNSAISARDTAESDLASDSTLQQKITLSNSIKEKINDEFNLRTWAYRIQIGQAQERKAGIDTFRNLIEGSDFQDLMNG